MSGQFNPAKHYLANRFRPRPQEILIATPINRIRPNLSPFNHLIFSNRNKKTPLPPVLTYNLPFSFSSPAKEAIRQGLPSRTGYTEGCAVGFWPPVAQISICVPLLSPLLAQKASPAPNGTGPSRAKAIHIQGFVLHPNLRRRNRKTAPRIPAHKFTAHKDRDRVLNFIDRIALLL